MMSPACGVVDVDVVVCKVSHHFIKMRRLMDVASSAKEREEMLAAAARSAGQATVKKLAGQGKISKSQLLAGWLAVMLFANISSESSGQHAI